MTKRFCSSWFWLGLIVSNTLSAWAQNSASVKAYCLSVDLGPATSGSLTAYFTTYDGTANIPLFDSVSGGIVVSGELSPAGNGKYQTDYGVTSFGEWASYGTASVTFPTTDSDSNGVPDFLQPELASNVTFAGTATEQMPSVATATISGRLTRSAGSLRGTYIAILQDGTSSTTYSGSTFLLNVTGTLTYTRGATNRATFTVTMTDSDGSLKNYSATSPFTVVSQDQISFPTTVFTSTSGLKVIAKPFALNRTLKKYIGTFVLQDGSPATTWADYTQWVAQFEDLNDTDGDGIPDLSDALPVSPTITTQPQGKIVTEGQSVSLTVVATGTAPLSYQWRTNGVAITGATSGTYSISAAKLSDAATYTVTVKNAAGSTTSQGAIISVNPAPKAPSITQQPLSQNVQAAIDVNFSVLASGTGTLSFEWRKQGVMIGGATNSTLQLKSVSTLDMGLYSVVVSNSVGTVTSSNASLIVNLVAPVISWATPADLTYGTVLSLRQLNAQARVPGTFAYNPSGGTKLHAGSGQTLEADFTPTDSLRYSRASAQVLINVARAPQSITFAALADKEVGNPSFDVGAIASSGLTPNFSVTGPATITGTTVTLTGGGTVTIIASQPGNSDYLPASSVAQSFNVSGGAQRPTISNWAVRNGLFSFRMGVVTNATYRLEESADCKSWAPIVTTSSPGALIDWIDPSPITGKRFYRAVMP